MKKVLVSLLVLALAMTSVFAAVNFSGEFVAGYTISTTDFKEWTTGEFGADKGVSNPVKLNVTAADENGLWSLTMKGVLQADNRLTGSANINLGKLFLGDESDYSLALDVVANNRVAGLNAYNNASGLNITRIRTLDQGMWAGLTFGYTDLVKVQVAGGTNDFAVADGSTNWGLGEGPDFLASVLVNPVEGIGISAGFVLNGEDKYDVTGSYKMNAAINVDIAKLADLDFDLGVAVGDKVSFDTMSNLTGITVYGGVDAVSFGAEYGLSVANDVLKHYFSLGADFNVVENLILNVYTGALGLGAYEYKDCFYAGGNIGYTNSGITFNLNLQYAAESASGTMGDVAQGAVKATGFSLTPSVKFAF